MNKLTGQITYLSKDQGVITIRSLPKYDDLKYKSYLTQEIVSAQNFIQEIARSYFNRNEVLTIILVNTATNKSTPFPIEFASKWPKDIDGETVISILFSRDLTSSLKRIGIIS